MSNLFILGFQKCGTTALADYFLKHNLVSYLVPNNKEPFIYAHSKPQSMFYERTVYLDSSVGYIKNINAINNLPEHNTKLIVCLRNQFERTWSCFKGYKLSTHQFHSFSYLMSFPTMTENAALNPKQVFFDIIKLHYPLKSLPFIEKYFDFEFNNIKNQTFRQRIQYELSFYLRRGEFPFLSILLNSFYSFSLKNLLNKYSFKELTLLNMDKIKSNQELRSLFIEKVFGEKISLPDIPELFSGAVFSIDEEKPNFFDADFDFLRSIFSDDISNLNIILEANNISDIFVDKSDLVKFF